MNKKLSKLLMEEGSYQLLINITDHQALYNAAKYCLATKKWQTRGGERRKVEMNNQRSHTNLQEFLRCRPVLWDFLETGIYKVSKIIRPMRIGKKGNFKLLIKVKID